MATFNFETLRSMLTSMASTDLGIASQIGEVTSERVVDAAEDLIGALNASSPADFGWSHGAPSVDGFSATIDVYPSNNTRPSLDQYDYPSGAIDLVDLLDRGYRASSPVYGFWNGAEIRSRTVFGGYNFLEPTISSFRSSHPYVNVTLKR